MLAEKYHNHMRASPNTNKRVIGPWVAHLKMVVYKVMDKHYRSQYSSLDQQLSMCKKTGLATWQPSYSPSLNNLNIDK